LANFIFAFSLSEIILNIFKTVLHLEQKLLFFIDVHALAFPKLIFQLSYFKLKFLYFITLKINKFKHLKILLLIFAENAQQLIKIIDLSCSFNFCEILSKFL